MTHISIRTRILLSSGSLALSLALLPSTALADCLPNAGGTVVTCQAADADGYTAGNGVTINVNTGATVAGPLTVGTAGQVNNEGDINTGTGTAISVGGGSGVANATLGTLTGNTLMGATTGTQVNIFDNLGTVAGDVTSSGALNFTNETSGSFTDNVGSTGNTSFSNAGTFIGNLTLGAGNDTITNTGTFTGGITLGGGTNIVTITNATQLPSLGITATAGTGATNTLVLGGTTSQALATSFANFDVLQKTGTGTWTLTAGSWTLEDRVQVDAGTLAVDDADFLGANKVTNNATVNFTNLAGGTYSGIMSGTGSVVVGGGGTATTIFSGANSYTGGTTITGGTLQLTGGAALADTGAVTVGALGALDVGASETIGALTNAGAVTLSAGSLTAASISGAGTIALTAGNLTAGNATSTSYSGVISGTGSLTKTGTGTLTLSGANTYSGGTTISGGMLTGDTTSLQGNIVDNAGLTFSQSANGTYAGNLTGTGTLIKAGTGTVTLSGTNSYSGATTVSAGTLIAGGTGIGDASAVTVASGATLQLGANETIGSLAGAGALDTAGFTLTTGGLNSSPTFSGAITGTGLTKTGTGTLTLSGTNTLSGALTVSAGTVALGGANTTGSASIASGATLDILTTGSLASTVTSVSGATLRVNGTLTGAFTNPLGGTLTGSGTIVGNVTNAGNLRPGNSPGIFHVTGNFTQSSTGTLNAEITPVATAGTGYDQVLVTGTATLGGTLALAPSAGLYVNGATYDVVRAAGGVSGSFSAITGTTISPFISLANTGIVTISGTDQAYRLTVARTSYATGMGSGATANQVATANGFQGLVTGATGDAATLVTAVDNMTAAQAQAFFDQTSPEGYGAYASALVDQGDLFTRQVGLHLAGGANRGAWVRLYGQNGEGKADGFRYGTDHDVTGVAGGFGLAANDTTYLGVALGYSEGPFHSELGNSDGDGKSWQAGVYGGYMAGPISANLQVAYIDTSADVTRSISAPAISRFTSANLDGKLWKIIGTVGYDMSTSGATIRPFVGIDYSNGEIKGFTETGASAASLTVSAIDADETDLMAGIDLAGNMGGLTPYGRFTYRYNLDGGDRNVSALFNGNSATAFTVSAIEPGRSQVDVDAGLRFMAGPAVSLSLGYQGMFRNDMTSHGVNGGIRFNF